MPGPRVDTKKLVEFLRLLQTFSHKSEVHRFKRDEWDRMMQACWVKVFPLPAFRPKSVLKFVENRLGKEFSFAADRIATHQGLGTGPRPAIRGSTELYEEVKKYFKVFAPYGTSRVPQRLFNNGE